LIGREAADQSPSFAKRRARIADASGLDSATVDIALCCLEIGMAPGPLDEDRRVTSAGHVREPRVAQIVEDDRSPQRIMLDVERRAAGPYRQ
jgi:hypothetical protein